MSLNKIITSAVLSASVAAGSLVPLSTAANAHEWNHRDGFGPRAEYVEHRSYDQRREYRDYDQRGYGGDHRWDRPRHNYQPPQQAWHDDDYRPRKRDHTGRNLAIGAFAAILGLAIVSEASRSHHGRYRD